MEKKKPEIRFNGFEGEWVKDNAVYIFETYYDKNHPNLPVLSASQELGMVIRDNVGFQVQHNKENEVGYKRVLPGQFVIHLRSFQGGFAHSMVEGITSPAYTVMQFKNSSTQDDIYWKYVLTSKTFIKRLETVTYGIRDGRSISFEDFSELNFTFPSLSEQEKIGLFLTTLDKLIAKLEAKLDKLRKLKQALLEKMFVNVNGRGYETPEIRFKGYTDKWQVKELREVFEMPTNRISGSELQADRYISTEHILQNFEGVEPTTSMPANLSAIRFFQNDILMANIRPYLKKIWLSDRNGGASSDVIVFHITIKSDPAFLYYELTNGRFIEYVMESIQGSKMPRGNKQAMQAFKMSIAPLSEQEQIGKCFTQIDTHFNKASTKLTKLRNIKQSLLQKMFA